MKLCHGAERMTDLVVTLKDPDASSFSNFGEFVMPPNEPFERRFFSDALTKKRSESAPILHVNHILPKLMPVKVSQIERHPHATQCFFPLDVSRYLVMVMPSNAAGQPCPDQTLGFLMPGTVGVTFFPGVWHMGATVLDRTGHFIVLMWRSGDEKDDDFRKITPITLVNTNQTANGILS